MVDYELAKELKEAGFEVFPDGDPGIVHDPEEDEIIPYPTLSELIEACGEGFRSLSLHSDGRWIAKAGKRAGGFLIKGKTMDIAVARLWLKLNENKEE